MEAVLSILLCYAPMLKAVLAHRCSISTVSLLPSFTALTMCELLGADGDLTPLQTLSNLQHLGLQSGTYKTAGMPAHLTYLYVNDSELHIYHDMSFATALQQLSVSYCNVSISPIGLTAFQALRLLHCFNSLVAMTDDHSKSDKIELRSESHNELPFCLSRLIGLTELHLELNGKAENLIFNLSLLYQLTALSSLDVSSTHAALIVSEGLTTLKMLTSLQLQMYSDNEEDREVHLISCAHWAAMQRLQIVSFDSQFFDFSSQISGLVELQSLRIVTFWNWTYSKDPNASRPKIITLVDILAVQRPDVQVYFGHLPAAAVRWKQRRTYC